MDITDEQRQALLEALNSSAATRNELRIAMHSNRKPHSKAIPAQDYEGEKRFKPIFAVLTGAEGTKRFAKYASSYDAAEKTGIAYYKWRDAARLGSTFKQDGWQYRCYFRSAIPTEYSEDLFVAS